jgi:outer membrane protein OmpA-like peptidoglycan-associated protein
MAPSPLDQPPATPPPASPPPTDAPAPATGAAAAGEVSPQAGDDILPEETDETRRWRERDAQVDESATTTGGVGLLHLQHAQGLAPGQFNLAFVTEYYTGNFLCTSSFPCSNQSTGAGGVMGDTENHIGGDLALTIGLADWLEGYAGVSAYANSDSANQPTLLQVLGDTDLGLKAYGSIGKVFHAGGAAELWLINGTGAVGVDGGGTSAKFRGIATADLRGTEKRTPLRFSLNAQYSLDNSGDVVSAYETQQNGVPVTRIERYGLNFNRVDHFDLGVGVEAFFVDDRIRPFLEYNILIPINRQNYECPLSNPSRDNCLQRDQLAPSKLTIGGRFLPWKHGFGITAAFDIGVTGQNDFIEEMAPIPPWTLYIGAGWTVDTQDRPRIVETKIVEKGHPAPLLGHIKGYVDETGHPETGVPNAIIAFANHPEITSLASGSDGHFTTLGLPPGKYDFTVKAEGYKDGACTATLSEPKPVAPAAPAPDSKTAPDDGAPAAAVGPVADTSVTCSLEALPRVGKVIGRVRDAETRNGVPNVEIKLADSGGHEFTQTSDANGTFHFDGLAPAGYTLTASADAYMNDVETLDVKPRIDTQADVVIMKRPKNPLVAVTQKEITIKQQVQFAVDSAVILPESNGLLTEIADVLNRNTRIHKVEIQGHTDSNGDDQHNQVLSEDRANSVRSWLVSHGVAGDRLDAKGYGEKKPLVPNVTEGNRQKNRRVQFIIVEQDKAAPAK